MCMRRNLYLIILSALLTSESNAQGCYPLEKGNIWEYQDPFDTTQRFTSRTLDSTTLPTGFSYSPLYSHGVYVDDTLFLRQVSSRVYNYSLRLQADELWYDFSKNIGDTIALHLQPFDTSDVVITDIRMVSFFIEFKFYFQQWHPRRNEQAVRHH